MQLFEPRPHPKYPEEYLVCRDTGVHFYRKAKSRDYGASYFLEEFKAQYKKTYYEDEPNLRSLARRRLQVLEGFRTPGQTRLLEIGCAAGFFLSEAKDMGWETKGIEVSAPEVEFARNVLNLDVVNQSFTDFSEGGHFDVISAFFVLEHFPDQEAVWKKVFSLLNPGGFVFLALPSLFGPSFQTNPRDWFQTHPTDHFADYDPISLQKTFLKFRAEVVWKKPMSFHSGRDRGWRGSFPWKFIYKPLASFSCYGDTMEVLAKKKN
jgi:2-polyprenyl-3-methyl-5-hydroxy-6-metoxy-1,4-benzoquinol methylase